MEIRKDYGDCGSTVAVNEETAMFNEYVLPYGHEEQKKFLQWLQVTLKQAFPRLYTSLFRMEPEANDHQYQKGNTTTKTNDHWEFFKEGTRHSHSKYSFCQITYKFTDILLSFMFGFFHYLKRITNEIVCQLNSSWSRNSLTTWTPPFFKGGVLELSISSVNLGNF